MTPWIPVLCIWAGIILVFLDIVGSRSLVKMWDAKLILCEDEHILWMPSDSPTQRINPTRLANLHALNLATHESLGGKTTWFLCLASLLGYGLLVAPFLGSQYTSTANARILAALFFLVLACYRYLRLFKTRKVAWSILCAMLEHDKRSLEEQRDIQMAAQGTMSALTALEEDTKRHWDHSRFWTAILTTTKIVVLSLFVLNIIRTLLPHLL